MLVDTSSKGDPRDLLPTVYALWRAPTLLPSVMLKHARRAPWRQLRASARVTVPLACSVSAFLIGGADLMLPGVSADPGGLPPFEEGALVSVLAPGNPAPLAVCSAALSSSEIVARTAAASKGRALSLIQVRAPPRRRTWSGHQCLRKTGPSAPSRLPSCAALGEIQFASAGPDQPVRPQSAPPHAGVPGLPVGAWPAATVGSKPWVFGGLRGGCAVRLRGWRGGWSAERGRGARSRRRRRSMRASGGKGGRARWR